jgi:hypothetical protein
MNISKDLKTNYRGAITAEEILCCHPNHSSHAILPWSIKSILRIGCVARLMYPLARRLQGSFLRHQIYCEHAAFYYCVQQLSR